MDGNRQIEKGHETWLNWLLVGLAAAAVALSYPRLQKTLQDELATMLPVHAVDFVLELGITGRMFNSYHYGGYLVYRLYPDQKVFVYGRTDFYQPGFLKENIDILGGGPRWKTLFDKYRFDYVICNSAAPLRQLLLQGREFRLVYDDALHSVLLRNEERFQPIIKKYERLPANKTDT